MEDCKRQVIDYGNPNIIANWEESRSNIRSSTHSCCFTEGLEESWHRWLRIHASNIATTDASLDHRAAFQSGYHDRLDLNSHCRMRWCMAEAKRCLECAFLCKFTVRVDACLMQYAENVAKSRSARKREMVSRWINAPNWITLRLIAFRERYSVLQFCSMYGS